MPPCALCNDDKSECQKFNAVNMSFKCNEVINGTLAICTTFRELYMYVQYLVHTREHALTYIINEPGLWNLCVR